MNMEYFFQAAHPVTGFLIMDWPAAAWFSVFEPFTWVHI
jgi:hypothetical protein